MENLSPLVSICCTAYNHEKYIKDALDGFLIQKTTFPFEIVVFDDASTDKTQQIILEYASNYPNLFRLFLQKENLWQNKQISGTFTISFPNARGKYIAWCEGDDYWTDPYKLQKQVDFLEKNEDYGLIHTNYTTFIQKENRFAEVSFKREEGNIFFQNLWGNQIASLTVLARKDLIMEAIKQDIFKPNFLMSDYPLWLFILYNSKVSYIDDVTSVYRVLEVSASHSNDMLKNLKFEKSVWEVRFYFANKYNCSHLVENDIVQFYKGQLKLCCYKSYKEYARELYLGLKGLKKVELKDSFYYFVVQHSKLNCLFVTLAELRKRIF